MQPHFFLLGKPGLLVPTREEGREEIQPPDPPSMLVEGPAHVQQCTLQRPRLHHHWGGWRPRKRPPDWAAMRASARDHVTHLVGRAHHVRHVPMGTAPSLPAAPARPSDSRDLELMTENS
ncbi:unnamed protein product [Rangifer tarandus platyrhynchus]|uniref:Uncharacterized protein n=1 Tax=Rangifer tarandus platyrhynchus TaxID=3082113 RepID=A0AC59ZRI8_RANTA